MSNKSIIGYKVTADFEKNTVIARVHGEKNPVYAAWDIDEYSMAEALRAIAYEAIRRAYYFDHQNDDYFSHVPDPALMETQFKKMMSENTLILRRA